MEIFIIAVLLILIPIFLGVYSISSQMVKIEEKLRNIKSEVVLLNKPDFGPINEDMRVIKSLILADISQRNGIEGKAVELRKVLETHLYIAKLKLGQDVDPESVFRIFTKSVDALIALKGRDNEEIARRATQFKVALERHKDNVLLQDVIFHADKESLMKREVDPMGGDSS